MNEILGADEMNKNAEKVNDRVKRVRKMYGLNQTEFGEKLGVSRAVIVNIELDKVRPKTVFLNHLCEVLHINIDWLVNGAGQIESMSTYNKFGLKELVDVYVSLSPVYQEYFLQQMKGFSLIQSVE